MMCIVTRFFLIVTVVSLSACGFHLRGQAGMPFDSIYLDVVNPKSSFVAELRNKLKFSKVKLADSMESADVVLNIVSENSEKKILTLSGSGRVTEYRLIYRISVRAYDQQQQAWIPATELSQHRDFSYDDTLVLAKESEEALLFKSMRSEMAQQILRRLNRAKPLPQ